MERWDSCVQTKSRMTDRAPGAVRPAALLGVTLVERFGERVSFARDQGICFLSPAVILTSVSGLKCFLITSLTWLSVRPLIDA